MKSQTLVSLVSAKISMIPLSDGSKTGEEPHDDRSDNTNAKSVIHLDIWCISYDVPTQAKIQKICYYR